MDCLVTIDVQGRLVSIWTLYFDYNYISSQLRDWNEELQSARELPRETMQQRLLRDRAIFKVRLDCCKIPIFFSIKDSDRCTGELLLQALLMCYKSTLLRLKPALLSSFHALLKIYIQQVSVLVNSCNTHYHCQCVCSTADVFVIRLGFKLILLLSVMNKTY